MPGTLVLHALTQDNVDNNLVDHVNFKRNPTQPQKKLFVKDGCDETAVSVGRGEVRVSRKTQLQPLPLMHIIS